MTTKQIIQLTSDQSRAYAVSLIRIAPEGHVCIIQEPKRNILQNAHFHAICGDIEKAGIVWAGKKRTAKEWKILLISGHAIATGEGADIVPGLESEFINLRESSALMGVKRASSLIEYSIAWAVSHDVKLIAPDYDESYFK